MAPGRTSTPSSTQPLPASNSNQQTIPSSKRRTSSHGRRRAARAPPPPPVAGDRVTRTPRLQTRAQAPLLPHAPRQEAAPPGPLHHRAPPGPAPVPLRPPEHLVLLLVAPPPLRLDFVGDQLPSSFFLPSFPSLYALKLSHVFSSSQGTAPP
ncbi:hypothetical protein VPH35_082712 [Triticum aestivum]